MVVAPPPEGLAGTARPQRGGPRRRRPRIDERRRQQPRREAAPQQGPAQGEELPHLVAADVTLDDADGQRAPFPHPREELVRPVDGDLARHARPGDVEAVPELGGHDLARATGVVPCHTDRVCDRGGFVPVEGERLDDGRTLTASCGRACPHDAVQHGADRGLLLDHTRVGPDDVDVEHPRDHVGPLHRAPDVEHAPRESAQHVGSCMRRSYRAGVAAVFRDRVTGVASHPADALPGDTR